MYFMCLEFVYNKNFWYVYIYPYVYLYIYRRNWILQENVSFCNDINYFVLITLYIFQEQYYMAIVLYINYINFESYVYTIYI